MTKQEILKLQKRSEIMKALSENRDIWDKELSDHLIKVTKKENKKLYGDEDFLDDPIQLKAP